MIKVRYESIDHYRETRTFKTLAGAQAYAERRVGPGADLGQGYAVSADGVGKVTVSGVTLRQLFKQPEPDYWWALVDAGRTDYYDTMGGPYMNEAQAQEAFFAWTEEDRVQYRLRIAKFMDEFDLVGYVMPNDKSPPPPPYAVIELKPAYCQITDAAIGSSSRVVVTFDTEAEAEADVAARYAKVGEHDEVDWEVNVWKPPVPTIAGPQHGYYQRRPSSYVAPISDAFDDMPF